MLRQELIIENWMDNGTGTKFCLWRRFPVGGVGAHPQPERMADLKLDESVQYKIPFVECLKPNDAKAVLKFNPNRDCDA